MLLCALAGCNDATSDPTGASDAAGPRGPSPDDAAVAADAGPGAADAVLGDAGSPDAADAPPPDADPGGGDAGPAAECVEDEDCGPERVCHQDRCIDGTRCETQDDCPAGRVCIAHICLADPQATGGLAAEPDRLLFTFADAGDQVTRATFLVNGGDAPVDVTALRLEGSPTFALQDAPETPLRLAPGHRTDVVGAYTADDRAPDAAVLVVEAAGAEEALRVRLASERKVIGGQQPCLQVVPQRLDFGAVTRGQTARRSFDLVGCGAVPVQVNGVRRGRTFLGELPPTFQLEQPPAFPLVLQPGDRQPITVAYSPRRAGIEGGFWEVLSDDANNPVQRVDVSAVANPPPLDEVALHVRLSWSTDLTDVDLHLIAPNGQPWTCEGDCYFSNPNPNWGDPARFEDDPFLDTDDVDGFGPENINLEDPVPGTYRVLVHYWDDHDGFTPDATVEILRFGQVIASYGPVSLPRVDDVWEVVDIEVPAYNLMPLGAVNHPPRGALCGGF